MSNILSIKEYNDTHNILILCGLKIKFQKLKHIKEKQNNSFYFYKKNNSDISKIPAATGKLREIQLANLALLKELDFVCKNNNLNYWLDSGTLLGAVRHKGFIPWDDDIDIGMMRDDYQKFMDIFNNSSRNKDIYAEIVQDKKDKCMIIIKVLHKKCPHLFVDIFPYDYYGEILSKNEQIQR
ncbi:MAG: LicD family protein, partial [Candidatus Gastranaerophilales bacterium]|nr:LicD family protein [Candidatus Gastranaerophilales bacterium]